MKVCLVAETAESKFGWGKYVYGMSQYLKHKKIKNKILIINQKHDISKLNKEFDIENIPPKKLGKATYLANSFFYYPKIFKTKDLGDYDLYHLTRQYPLLIRPLKFRGKKVIVSGMDLFYLTFNRKWYSWIYHILLKNLNYADKIITISNSVKKDMINLLKIPEEKIKTVYLGVDKKIFHPVRQTNLQKIFENNWEKIKGKKLILHVGADVQRKNIKNLVLAFYKIKKTYPDSILIRVQGTVRTSNETQKLIKQLNLQGSIIFLNNIPNGDLNLLYNACDVFIFPSFCEGFGMPILEAMAAGAAIITSKGTATEELIGNAGITIDPKNVNELAIAIKKVINDKEFAKKIRKKAFERSKLFSWEKTFKETEKIYKSV